MIRLCVRNVNRFIVHGEQREEREVNVDDEDDLFTMISFVTGRPRWRVDTQTRDEYDTNRLQIHTHTC